MTSGGLGGVWPNRKYVCTHDLESVFDAGLAEKSQASGVWTSGGALEPSPYMDDELNLKYLEYRLAVECSNLANLIMNRTRTSWTNYVHCSST